MRTFIVKILAYQRISLIQTLCISILLSFFTTPGRAQDIYKSSAKIDKRVIDRLTVLKYQYEVEPDGTIKFILPISKNKRSQTLYIRSVTDWYDQLEIREIYSVIYKSDKRPPEYMLAKVLFDNSRKKLGAWELIYEDAQYHILFNAKVTANESPQNIKSIIDIVGAAADDMEQELFISDNW
ncbi:hypothetical protein [uncultured Microscilla sp.]|uniref:hypothetical protein n=1 Tax=uncultured Microscilla sp. TaxID=432653 RepID=UPI00262A3902|nr:hypothetical protein [uncultured Microscilla sp.]